jgi:hypothetical protein
MKDLADFDSRSNRNTLADIEGKSVVIDSVMIDESEFYGEYARFNIEGDENEYVTFATAVVAALKKAQKAGALPIAAKFVKEKTKGGRTRWAIEKVENT